MNEHVVSLYTQWFYMSKYLLGIQDIHGFCNIFVRSCCKDKLLNYLYFSSSSMDMESHLHYQHVRVEPIARG